MARIGTRKLTLSLADADVSPEVSKVVINAAATDSDFVSFADAAGGSGSRAYTLGLTLAQDAVAGTVWDYIWSHAGTDVAFVIRPYGNATPSTTEPHFTGTATIVEPDGELLGGEANVSVTAVMTVEVEWPLLAKPTKVTA